MAEKKGKKQQAKAMTLSLDEFQELDWADEAESHALSNPTRYTSRFEATKEEALPTAPRAQYEAEFDFSTLPAVGPYEFRVSNLSFDVGNEEFKAAFEEKVSVVDVRIVEDGGRKRGFGFVKVPTIEDLKKALKDCNNMDIRGRRVQVKLAHGRDERESRFGNDRGDRKDRYGNQREGPSAPAGDWRSGPLPDLPQRPTFGARDQGGRGFQRDDRGSFNRFGGDRDQDFRRDDRPFTRDQAQPRGMLQEQEKTFSRDQMAPRGLSGERDRYGPSDDFASDRRSAEYQRRPYRGAGERGGFERSDSAADQQGLPPVSQVPTVRKKIVLEPRKVEKPIGSSDRPSSIFGAAKPVDTAAKALEVERKLQEEQKRLEEKLHINESHGGERRISNSSDYSDRRSYDRVATQSRSGGSISEDYASGNDQRGTYTPDSSRRDYADSKLSGSSNCEARINSAEEAYSNEPVADFDTEGGAAELGGEAELGDDGFTPVSGRQRQRGTRPIGGSRGSSAPRRAWGGARDAGRKPRGGREFRNSRLSGSQKDDDAVGVQSEAAVKPIEVDEKASLENSALPMSPAKVKVIPKADVGVWGKKAAERCGVKSPVEQQMNAVDSEKSFKTSDKSAHVEKEVEKKEEVEPIKVVEKKQEVKVEKKEEKQVKKVEEEAKVVVNKPKPSWADLAAAPAERKLSQDYTKNVSLKAKDGVSRNGGVQKVGK